MKAVLATIILCLAALNVRSAALSHSRLAPDNGSKAIRAAYARYDQASSRDDAPLLIAFYRACVTEHYVLVDQKGNVTTRSQILNSLNEKARQQAHQERMQSPQNSAHQKSTKSTISHIEIKGETAVVLGSEVQEMTDTDGIDPNTPGPEGGAIGPGRGLRRTITRGREIWVHAHETWKIRRTNILDVQQEFLYENGP